MLLRYANQNNYFIIYISFLVLVTARYKNIQKSSCYILFFAHKNAKFALVSKTKIIFG